MRNLLIIMTFLTASLSAHAFRMTLLTSFDSKKLTGTDAATQADGNLISNANFNYGLNLSFGFSKNLHLLLGYQSRSYDFDNTENIIEGESAVDANKTEIGLRWILFARTALRFNIVSEDTIGFSVNANNRVELFTENINYLNIYYDQIVYMGGRFFGGFKVGYDIPANGTEIQDRSSTKYGVFVTMNTSGLGQFEGYFEIINTDKSDDNLAYTESDQNFNLNWTVSF